MTLITPATTAATTTSSSATASPVVIVSAAVLLLFGNVDAQTRGCVLQPNAPVQVESLLQMVQCLELHVAEALELVRLLVLHQTHVLHVLFAEDLRDIALDDALRQVSHESDVRRLRRQLLGLAVSTVVSPGQSGERRYSYSRSATDDDDVVCICMCIHVSFG